MPEEVTPVVLDAITTEVVRLKDDFDERYITAMRHLVLGEKEQATKLFSELACIDEALTYIKEYLESKYKQVINLH